LSIAPIAWRGGKKFDEKGLEGVGHTIQYVSGSRCK
jgi:hypothetical protein